MKSYLSLALLMPLAVSAQSLSEVRSSAREDLNEAKAELAQVRSEIQEAKIPLAREVNRLEEQVVQQRREVDNLRRIRDASSIDLNQIQNFVGQLRDQQDYLTNLLNEFTRSFEERLHISENPQYAPLTQEARNAPTNPNLSAEAKVDAQLDVVEAALDRLDAIIGGRTYEGTASAAGASHDGKFLNYGPTVFFASNDGAHAGYAQRELNAPEPAVISLGEARSEQVAAAVQAGSGVLPVDPTLGKALQIAVNSKSLMQYIEDGRWVGAAILALGAVSLLLALFKVYEIVTFSAPTSRDVAEVLAKVEEGDEEAARGRAAKVKGQGGEMLLAGVESFGQKRTVIEEIMFERVLLARPLLERFLPFLAITAAVAPLMGLLGTVIGMIRTFNLITIFGTGDAKSLSGGISEALVTTALGLVVAIPILVLHGILLRMSKKKVAQMEQGVVSFVNGVAVSARHHEVLHQNQ